MCAIDENYIFSEKQPCEIMKIKTEGSELNSL